MKAIMLFPLLLILVYSSISSMEEQTQDSIEHLISSNQSTSSAHVADDIDEFDIGEYLQPKSLVDSAALAWIVRSLNECTQPNLRELKEKLMRIPEDLQEHIFRLVRAPNNYPWVKNDTQKKSLLFSVVTKDQLSACFDTFQLPRTLLIEQFSELFTHAIRYPDRNEIVEELTSLPGYRDIDPYLKVAGIHSALLHDREVIFKNLLKTFMNELAADVKQN